MINKGLILAAISPFAIHAQVINHPETGQQVRANCDYYAIYVQAKLDYSKELQITHNVNDTERFKHLSKIYSPSSDSFIQIHNNQTTRLADGSGKKIEILLKTESKPPVLFTFANLNSFGVNAYWQQNSTLIIEVWRGRIYQTVYTYNVEADKIVAAEDRNYFEQTLPCIEKKEEYP